MNFSEEEAGGHSSSEEELSENDRPNNQAQGRFQSYKRQDRVEEPQEGCSPFDSIPKVKYKEFLSKKRARPQSSKKKKAPARKKKKPEPVPVSDSSSDEQEEEDEAEQPFDEELHEFAEKKSEEVRQFRHHLWRGYVNLVGAADAAIGQPSGAAEMIGNDPDIKSCFESCLESNSFGKTLRTIDPIYLLLFSTGMVVYQCKRSGAVQQTTQIPHTYSVNQESPQQQKQTRVSSFKDLFDEED